MKRVRKPLALLLLVVMVAVSSVTVLANSGTNTGTINSYGTTLTHRETYTGTLQMLQALVSCTGAQNAEVRMNAYYSMTPGGLYYPAAGNTYSQYMEPGNSAGVTYRPQSGTTCYRAHAWYYINNTNVWDNEFYGYK